MLNIDAFTLRFEYVNTYAVINFSESVRALMRERATKLTKLPE